MLDLHRQWTIPQYRHLTDKRGAVRRGQMEIPCAGTGVNSRERRSDGAKRARTSTRLTHCHLHRSFRVRDEQRRRAGADVSVACRLRTEARAAQAIARPTRGALARDSHRRGVCRRRCPTRGIARGPARFHGRTMSRVVLAARKLAMSCEARFSSATDRRASPSRRLTAPRAVPSTAAVTSSTASAIPRATTIASRVPVVATGAGAFSTATEDASSGRNSGSSSKTGPRSFAGLS